MKSKGVGRVGGDAFRSGEGLGVEKVLFDVYIESSADEGIGAV